VVERSWNTSARQKDKEEQITDTEGRVQFDKETGTVPLMGRLVRPLAAFLPMPCAPGSEFYTHTTFRIFWPNGYTLKFDDKEWRQAYNAYCNRERIFIRDPQFSKRRRDSFAMVTEANGGFQLIPTNWVESYVELYFSNRERDFDFTLQIYKAETR
jgi:hypothetical protein